MIHLGRLRDRSRKVLEITEVIGYENGKIVLQPLYQFQEEGKHEKVQGKLVKVGELRYTDKLLAAGYSLDGENQS
jgi:pilus assembly protein CpaF